MLAARRVIPERMDDPALDRDDHLRALAGLTRLNAVSRPLAGLTGLVRRAVERVNRPVRVLDVACGGGDNLVRLLRWADRAGIDLHATGCDISPAALADADERAAEADVRAEWVRCDAVREPVPAGFDVVTSSLFLHHLPDAAAATLLANLRDAAGVGLLVNDLVRGPVNLLAVWVGSRLLTGSPVVRFDAPASVRAAFTPAELRQLAATAGLDGAVVRKVLPCRMTLTWERP